MLIKLETLIQKYGLKISGVVHVGGHHGEEYDDYIAAGIENQVWVEPCQPAFNVLAQKLLSHDNILLFNCALGATECRMEMNIEIANTGQSNSLLAPKKHLNFYPSITFDKTETVIVRRMDNLDYDRSLYNFLNMDVQGYECEVLKGGTESLKSIEYIYTEVNTDELYANCATLEEMDAMLNDFTRMELSMTDAGWGDAFYIRKSKM